MASIACWNLERAKFQNTVSPSEEIVENYIEFDSKWNSYLCTCIFTSHTLHTLNHSLCSYDAKKNETSWLTSRKSTHPTQQQQNHPKNKRLLNNSMIHHLNLNQTLIFCYIVNLERLSSVENLPCPISQYILFYTYSLALTNARKNILKILSRLNLFCHRFKSV